MAVNAKAAIGSSAQLFLDGSKWLQPKCLEQWLRNKEHIRHLSSVDFEVALDPFRYLPGSPRAVPPAAEEIVQKERDL